MTSELSGAIQNAMERKEPLERTKATLVNAGYPPIEVNQAIQEATSNIFQTSTQNPNQPAPQFQPLPAPNTIQEPKQKSNKLLYIILGSAALLILIGAGLLGLFWGKIFK